MSEDSQVLDWAITSAMEMFAKANAISYNLHIRSKEKQTVTRMEAGGTCKTDKSVQGRVKYEK